MADAEDAEEQVPAHPLAECDLAETRPWTHAAAWQPIASRASGEQVACRDPSPPPSAVRSSPSDAEAGRPQSHPCRFVRRPREIVHLAHPGMTGVASTEIATGQGRRTKRRQSHQPRLSYPTEVRVRMGYGKRGGGTCARWLEGI